VEATKANALKAGAVGFISKPFKERSLINCLDAALKKPEGEGGK
jgi:FixJ family two-component response regulator